MDDFGITVPPCVRRAVDRILARTRRNVAAGLPLDFGARPYLTLREFAKVSQAARVALVESGGLIFQNASQKADLLDPALTETYLIALLEHLVFEKGWPIEITAVRSDHHDDSGLAPAPLHEGTHACGWAADLWPLLTRNAGDYVDAGEDRFRRFLVDADGAPYRFQVGLGGSADAFSVNRNAAGAGYFPDSGADHVHLSVRQP